MTVNGDAFVIKHWPGHTLIAVIDGVGHGQYANRASNAACTYIETHHRQPMEDLFMGTARACRGSRGVVMAVAVFDWRTAQITFASIGNIETRVYNASRDKMFSVRRGIVGLQMPKPRVTTESWEKGSIMLMHSDGLSAHWSLKKLQPMQHLPAAAIARKLLTGHAKDQDDATIAVIKDRRGDG